MKFFQNACLASALSVASFGGAHAAIATGDNPELLLLIWDPVAKVSYTKDLGINASEFWVAAQQDAGYSKFINVDKASDSRFASFVAASTDQSKQIWAVVGADTAGDPDTVGDYRLFTTLRQGGGNIVNGKPVVNPEWTLLTGVHTDAMAPLAGSVTGAGLIGPLNGELPSASNTHAQSPDSTNGSSFATEKTGVYLGGPTSAFKGKGAGGITGEYLNTVYNPFNAVGKSSWFYFASVSQIDDTSLPMAVDEFDNLGADGYWGLGVDANGVYVLSFNMPAYTKTALVSTAEGRQRLSTTDFASGFASRQIAVPADEFAVHAVTAVPEPSSWALMGLGLLGLGAVARRRARG